MQSHCIKSFGQTEDEAEVLAHQISGHRDATADSEDQLSDTDARIERIPEEIIDVHVQRVTEETVVGEKHNPQERVQSHKVEQIVAVPVVVSV